MPPPQLPQWVRVVCSAASPVSFAVGPHGRKPWSAWAGGQHGPRERIGHSVEGLRNAAQADANRNFKGLRNACTKTNNQHSGKGKGVNMAVVMISETPGGTQAEYERLIENMHLADKPALGQILHAAAPMQGGWLIVDVWESQEAADTFYRERLAPALQQAGITQGGQPKVYPVYRLVQV